MSLVFSRLKRLGQFNWEWLFFWLVLLATVFGGLYVYLAEVRLATAPTTDEAADVARRIARVGSLTHAAPQASAPAPVVVDELVSEADPSSVAPTVDQEMASQALDVPVTQADDAAVEKGPTADASSASGAALATLDVAIDRSVEAVTEPVVEPVADQGSLEAEEGQAESDDGDVPHEDVETSSAPDPAASPVSPELAQHADPNEPPIRHPAAPVDTDEDPDGPAEDLEAPPQVSDMPATEDDGAVVEMVPPTEPVTEPVADQVSTRDGAAESAATVMPEVSTETATATESEMGAASNEAASRSEPAEVVPGAVSSEPLVSAPSPSFPPNALPMGAASRAPVVLPGAGMPPSQGGWATPYQPPYQGYPAYGVPSYGAPRPYPPQQVMPPYPYFPGYQPLPAAPSYRGWGR